MDKVEEVEPQQSSKAMDEEDHHQLLVDDPYGFLVEQCIIPSAEENQLRSMPLFSPTPTPIPTQQQQQQQQPSPPPVVKHEQQTDDEIDIIMQQQQQPLEMDKEKEKEATENMEVDDEEESQSVTKEPTISVESSPPPFQNEGFSLQSPPPTRDEPAAIDDGTPSPVTVEELQKTIESPLEQNEVLVAVQPQSPTTKTQTGQPHFVPPSFQPTATAVGVGASSSSSSNPGNPKEEEEEEEDNTTIDILDVLRSKGFYVPRPRWWRPEGYDKP